MDIIRLILCRLSLLRRANYPLSILIVTAVLVTMTPSASQASCPSGPAPCFVGIGFLDNNNPISNVGGISADGSVVVGNHNVTADAYRWVNGTMTRLPPLNDPEPFAQSQGYGVSADGNVAIGFSTTGTNSNGPNEGVGWTGTSPNGVGFLSNLCPPSSSSAEAASANGSVIVGSSIYGSNCKSEAYKYANGTMTGLGFLSGDTSSYAHSVSSDGSVVVGDSGANGFGRMVSWINGTIGTLSFLSGGTFGTAAAVSADGSVVVGSSEYNATGKFQAFRWVNGTIKGLGFERQNDDVSHAYAVNADGSVVVGDSYNFNASNLEAFRWTQAAGMQSVQTLLTAAGVNTAGWQLYHASAVSADGTVIAGSGQDPNGHTQGWIARVPLQAGTAAHDFNGDHVSDILWHHSNGSVSTWQMAANGTHAAFSFGTVNTAWQIAGTTSLVASTGDVNGGGKVDIFWRHTNGSLSLWEMNGGAAHTPVNLGVVAAAWQIAGVGDFDGDGHADILWRHTNGSVSIWKMAANGSHTVLNFGVVDTAWQVAGIGDVNHDGKADIIWRHTNGTALIWRMTGGTSHTVLNLGAVATAWQIVGVGDVDGDGNADLFWRHTNGTLSIWKMAANGTHTVLNPGIVATAWQVASIGDYNGDGRADILWRNTNGSVLIWTMNANGTHTSVSLGTVATAWTIVE